MNQPIFTPNNNSWNRNNTNLRNFRNPTLNMPLNSTQGIDNSNSNYGTTSGHTNQHNINNRYLNNRNIGNYKTNNNQFNNNDGMDDLVNKMNNLQIKTCYFCNQPGHLIKDCVELTKLEQDPNFVNYFNFQKN